MAGRMATTEFLQRLSVNQPRANNPSSRSAIGQPRPSRGPAILMMAADVLTVLVSILIAFRLVLSSGPIGGIRQLFNAAEVHSQHPVWLLCGLLAWFIISLLLSSRRYHLYTPLRISNTLREQRLTVQACLNAGLLLTGAIYVFHAPEISRGVVFVMTVSTMIMLCLRRLMYRAALYRRYDKGLERRNILIVGTGRVGQALRHHIESVRHLGYSFKGYISVPGVEGEASMADGEVLGSLDTMFDLARKNFVDEIFFATPCERGLVKKAVEQARITGVDLRVVPDLYDGLAWNSQVEYVGQFPTLPLHRGEVPEISLLMKRALDVTVSMFALTLLSPLMLIIAIAVKLDSRGPIFYSSERIGKKGRVFRCVKFRTMVADAERRRAEIMHMNEREGVLFKVTNDPRITRVGTRLRKYSLDELPQFFNVLRGDMSIVGPRPPIASEVKQYDLSHLRRLDVTPGITGLWQVEARQDPSFDSYISLDTAYVENWSLWLDLKIMIRTVTVIFAGTGA